MSMPCWSRVLALFAAPLVVASMAVAQPPDDDSQVEPDPIPAADLPQQIDEDRARQLIREELAKERPAAAENDAERVDTSPDILRYNLAAGLCRLERFRQCLDELVQLPAAARSDAFEDGVFAGLRVHPEFGQELGKLTGREA